MTYTSVCLTFFRRIMQHEYYKSAVKKFGNTRYFDILNNIYTDTLQVLRILLQEDTGDRKSRTGNSYFLEIFSLFFLKNVRL